MSVQYLLDRVNALIQSRFRVVQDLFGFRQGIDESGQRFYVFSIHYEPPCTDSHQDMISGRSTLRESNLYAASRAASLETF